MRKRHARSPLTNLDQASIQLRRIRIGADGLQLGNDICIIDLILLVVSPPRLRPRSTLVLRARRFLQLRRLGAARCCSWPTNHRRRSRRAIDRRCLWTLRVLRRVMATAAHHWFCRIFLRRRPARRRRSTIRSRRRSRRFHLSKWCHARCWFRWASYAIFARW